VLRRQKSETATAEPEAPLKQGGKGRPTPTRREAEAESRRRARAAMDSKAAKKQQRQQRSTQARKVRQGMKDGDERYLMKRDQGPVKRAVRTYVDSRLSIAEFLLPLLLVALVLQGSGNPGAVGLGASLVTTTSLVALIDTTWVVYRLKRKLRADFPDESLKGVTVYTVMRLIQMRPLRMPKPQVKIGGAPKTPK
jgi:hypothetical protein